MIQNKSSIDGSFPTLYTIYFLLQIAAWPILGGVFETLQANCIKPSVELLPYTSKTRPINSWTRCLHPVSYWFLNRH